MNYPATLNQTQRFKAVVGQKIGLRFDDAKLAFLGEVLQRRLKDRGRDGESYLWELEYEPPNAELAALARELTVGETYFFRNNEQFRALAEVVLPDRMRMRSEHKELRLLSAGCSSGEEAYSMAMVAQETIADPAWKVSVRAVDLNPNALEKALRGRYSPWALREVSAEMRAKRFRADGRDATLDDAIRAMVTFEQANLASENPSLWQPAAYDVIFCRNALMYFEPDQMRAVIERIARSLAPGGFLFLGHAETLRVSRTNSTCATPIRRSITSSGTTLKLTADGSSSLPRGKTGPGCRRRCRSSPGSTRYVGPASGLRRCFRLLPTPARNHSTRSIRRRHWTCCARSDLPRH